MGRSDERVRVQIVYECCPPLQKEAFIALARVYIEVRTTIAKRRNGAKSIDLQKTINASAYAALYSRANGASWLRDNDTPVVSTAARMGYGSSLRDPKTVSFPR